MYDVCIFIQFLIGIDPVTAARFREEDISKMHVDDKRKLLVAAVLGKGFAFICNS